jgi:gamma-glutamyltranspeptidase/glutathione hydrolase
MRHPFLAAGLLLSLPGSGFGQEADLWKASGNRGAVAAGGKEAADAGLEILKAGGNAVDAAAATLIALSVTDWASYCFGGEAPMIVYDAKRKVVEVLCALGTAPRLATREHFEGRGGIPLSGIEPAPVPAVVDGLVTALDRYGTRTFAEVAAPTLRLLDALPERRLADLARTRRRLIEAEKASPDDRRRGLRLVSDCFYRGPIAREIDAFCRENGGLLRATDLATHVTRIEEPASAEYRGHAVYKCGAWNQGPDLLQTLRLLEGFDLGKMGHNGADAVHVSVEAMKLALADRDVYYADPLFEDVPLRELLSKEYADLRRPLIDLETASLVQRPGDPRAMKALLGREETRRGLGGRGKDTTTCVVADAEGNIVAATPSGFSGVVAGRTGVWLSTRLQSFNVWEGHPNCIVPGKRPRIMLTPTLVLKDGKPVIAVSVAGGDLQDQATLQLLLNVIDFGLDADRAVTSPRFYTNHLVNSFGQTPPELGSLTVERGFAEDALEALRARGHKVGLAAAPHAAPVILTRDPETGLLRAAGDPKTGRHAAAW